KALTKRNGGKPLQRVIKELNPKLRGFSQYFRIANASNEFKKLAAWLRRRLRSIQLRLWKKPSRLHRRLKQLGYKPPFKGCCGRKYTDESSSLQRRLEPSAFKLFYKSHWIPAFAGMTKKI
ncbi:hypothetical protein L2734_17435, partial [Parashewanella spongiae]